MNETIKIRDIVQLTGGCQFIVTAIKSNRPANPYTGVKVNGHGTEYKFGPKHRPVIVGHADDSHPALRAKDAKTPTTVANVGIIEQLLDAVEVSDFGRAKILAGALRTTPEFSRC